MNNVSLNIIKAIEENQLLRPFLADAKGSLRTWSGWRSALQCLYGVAPVSKAKLVRQCTGRDASLMPTEGFDQAAFLCGRRSGKSRIAAVIATFEAAISGKHKQLAPGETGMVAVLSPTRRQSAIVKNYIRGAFDESPLLAGQIVEEQKDGFTLKNGVRIEIATGDWRSVRGYTLLVAIVDEACFFQAETESKVRTDSELVRALQPSLATLNGKLVCISSPYARQGWCFKQHEKCWGNDSGQTLVWRSPSRVMNPTLPQKVVDRALADDLQSARAEYLAEWRDDVSSFVSLEMVNACVKAGRSEIPPTGNGRYVGFVDLSGGRHDDAVLCIGHKAGRKVVVDVLRRWRPPFNPRQVIGQMSLMLNNYSVRKVIGDNYGAEFAVQAFKESSIRYQSSKQNKSQLYLELLPILAGEEIELVDDRHLVDQLCRLERKVRSGGRDTIDHPRGGHDDLANAVAGMAAHAANKIVTVLGGF